MGEEIAKEDEKMQGRINVVLDKLENIEEKLSSLEAHYTCNERNLASLKKTGRLTLNNPFKMNNLSGSL